MIPAFLFVLAATVLEAVGDAIVRTGIGHSEPLMRIGLFFAGAVLLFGYGLCLNLAPIEFGRVVGLYIAILFLVWQVVNFIAFRTVPGLPIAVGGSLIVAGGLIVSCGSFKTSDPLSTAGTCPSSRQ